MNFVEGVFPNSTDSFRNVGNSGAFWDNDRILFYYQTIFQSKNTGRFYPNNNGNVNKFSLNSEYFNLSFLKRDVDIYCRVLQEENGNNQYTPFKSISISRYNGFPTSAKENLLLLGIKIDELQSLIDATNEINPNTQLPNLSTKHYRYLFLEEELPSKTDKDGYLFRKFKLKVQGIAPTNDIFLYTRDGLCFTSKEFAESETDNDVKNLIDFIPLDKNDIYKSVKRLSRLTNENTWQLHNLDGVPKKYDAGEINYAGGSISGKQIELPVGTRSIILGESKNKINNYIVCFHEGNYREGFVNKNAFINSNKDEYGTLVRVNKLEGHTHPELIWKPFLDDAKRIINYCEKINSLSNVFPPFRNLIIDTRNKFKTILNTFTPYSNPSSLIIKLQQLNTIIQSTNNISDGLGNLATNLDNTVDSVNRWLVFPPFKDVILDHVYSIENIVTNGFKSLVFPISRQWFLSWKDTDSIFRNVFYDETIHTAPNSTFQYKLSDILNILTGNTGSNNTVASDDYYIIKFVLQTLMVSFKNRTDISPIIQTPEAIWLKSLDENSIDDIPNIISIEEEPWSDTKGDKFNLSLVLTDHSIGYINSISALSLVIHEVNTYHDVKENNTPPYNGNSLYFDTHGEQLVSAEFLQIQQMLISNNTALGYFDFFPDKKNQDGPWLALVTNPNTSILYLNYYLTKLLF